MDILIKNLKMPIGERKVVLILKSDGEVSVYADKRLVRFTEAVALPSHGRLIDVDGLMKKVREEADFPSCEWCKAIECLEDAPTVLEANNGTDS